MNRHDFFALLLVASLAGCSSMPGAPNGANWSVSKNTDPITGVSHCVLASYDTAVGVSFTRVGYLYPFVENNSQLGVLVGVSSGGTVRLPVGTILWRVDDKPFRTLNPIDNPGGSTNAPPPLYKAENLQATTEWAQNLARSVTATATVAGGSRAQEMLNEMLNGKSLIFRAAAAASPYGIPNEATTSVGQFRNGDIRPIPIDDSFRQGLTACDIHT